MKQLLFIVLAIYWNSCYSQTTTELLNLINKVDSISIIYETLEEEEILSPGDLNEMNLSEFCYSEHTNYPIKSTQQIIKFLNGFEYRETEDVMFCGFDYILTGYSNQEELFTLKINSECNYVWSDFGRYFISDFHNNKFLQSLPAEQITTCYFIDSKLMANFISSEKRKYPNESIEFLKNRQQDHFSVTEIRKMADR